MVNEADNTERKCTTRPRRITISSLNCEEVGKRMKRWKEEDEHYKEELAEMEERHQQKVYQLIDDQDAAQIDICEAEEAFSKAVRGTWHDDNKELKAADVERRKVRDELHKLVWEMEEEYHVHGRAVRDLKEKYGRQIRERKPAGEQQTQVRPEDFAEDEDMEEDAPQEFLGEHQSELRGGEHSDCPVTAISTNGPPAVPPSSPTIPTDDLAQRRDPDGLSQLGCVMRGASSMGTPGRLLARSEKVGAWDEEEKEEEEEEMVVRGDAETDNNPAIVSPRRHDDDDALPFVPCRGRTATPFRCGTATPDSAASSSSLSHTVSPDLRSSPLAMFGGLDGAMDDEMIEECEGCEDVQGGRAEKKGAEGAGCSKEKGPAGTPKRAESYPRKQQPVSEEGPASDRYVSKHITMSGTIIVLKTGRKSAEKSHGDRSGKQD
ncbi:hypothetical protein NpPPO83_00001543 [Neofusicoccum parvum]|uniref:Uncharacterized protein n=1 Tax=Neofusicoccum parvum TaxID=310453 RepID=A0ACB5S061_9PEZI|nr:hypothetical protein NpPPO83_00001543 [Neofusicoccum parvum]